uniref:Uncharacterized protein n=1 Tax=Nelumbo nucifera TaxID=4432 RepID=A0A822ZQW3_NELNU|nr:TPA_asm: hypothetical protein HUJ06_017214 [Nelumbo nucifera]
MRASQVVSRPPGFLSPPLSLSLSVQLPIPCLYLCLFFKPRSLEGKWRPLRCVFILGVVTGRFGLVVRVFGQLNRSGQV